jgi:hypothetical protein
MTEMFTKFKTLFFCTARSPFFFYARSLRKRNRFTRRKMLHATIYSVSAAPFLAEMRRAKVSRAVSRCRHMTCYSPSALASPSHDPMWLLSGMVVGGGLAYVVERDRTMLQLFNVPAAGGGPC